MLHNIEKSCDIINFKNTSSKCSARVFCDFFFFCFFLADLPANWAKRGRKMVQKKENCSWMGIPSEVKNDDKGIFSWWVFLFIAFVTDLGVKKVLYWKFYLLGSKWKLCLQTGLMLSWPNNNEIKYFAGFEFYLKSTISFF